MNNIFEFIEDAKNFMANNSDDFNPDQIEAFKDIEVFFKGGFSQTDLASISGLMEMMKSKIIEEAKEDANDYEDEDENYVEINVADEEKLVEKYVIKTFFHFGMMYLLMIRANKAEVSQLKTSLLFVTVNAMRGVPCNKYNEAIKKLSYPPLVDAIIENDDKETVSRVLSILTDRVTDSNELFDENALDEYMNNFLVTTAYPRLGIEPRLNETVPTR